VAAVTALQDKDHLDWEREENAQIRAFTTAALRELGCTVPDSQTNHLFVNLHRSAPAFRDACLAQKIQLGRDFPPFQETHTRISLGSREEMRIAVEVFRKVLSA
jgi:histidinol-phosphate/aromatic aminotransferase/cobyric acid decarboxylase-like protein